ncbi:hypothetical protein [Acetobacter persici]|uniref:hypothetical protein n=1 Tax=Acetobacter persici TaxID=1076596 RepID=UPI001BA44BFF|nr:hypothetical protein [Acetobacter persici]MBS1017101.1 hypothetical protein [Acetobacter persici]
MGWASLSLLPVMPVFRGYSFPSFDVIVLPSWIHYKQFLLRSVVYPDTLRSRAGHHTAAFEEAQPMMVNRKAKIQLAVILFFALLCEGASTLVIRSWNTDRQDDFMMPCIQHQEVNVCLAEWQKRK